MYLNTPFQSCAHSVKGFKTELPEDSDECIMCHHSPLDKSICTPNKSMRTTIRALLKNKFETRFRRQAAEAAKAAKESEAVSPTVDNASKPDEPSTEAERDGGAQTVNVGSHDETPYAPTMEATASATSHKSLMLQDSLQTPQEV